MEKIVVETLCADLAAEGDCPGAAWNALWEWLTDVAAPEMCIRDRNLLDFRAVWCYNTLRAVKHCAIDSGRGCA